ncbi:tyrosine-type recombinase/integrase [Pseudonocardia xishanensis]|uniref:Tyr recombinase domain-containing protein n=1 Tax=Pseudonocardia xishanensis TaxID=630995 RepID=A0ABP8RV75_9PSEU
MVKALRSIVRGPLEPYVTGIAEALLRHGYSRSSASQHLCFIAHLDRWMHAEGCRARRLECLGDRAVPGAAASCGVRGVPVGEGVATPLGYLAPLGVLPIPQDVAPGPVEELLGRYRVWLLVERGVTPETARGYVDCVRPFVATRVRSDALELSGMSAADVTAFVLASCPGRAVGSAKLIVCAPRSLLGWLHLSGAVPVSLVAAVPSVAGWRLSGLPKGLEPGQLRSLLAACDRCTPTGRRDYAIMLLLARLGLRAGEVARLGLDDVDWRRGEIAVLGKGKPSDCRCPPRWVRRSRGICGAADRAPRRDAACSSASTPRIGS